MLGEKKENRSSIWLQHVHQRILSSRFELKGHYSYFRHIALNIEDMQGKSLGEKSARMAEAWRKLSEEERSTYSNLANRSNSNAETPECLSVAEKKKIVMRMAKRHQGDVS